MLLQMYCPWRDKIPDAKSPATNFLSLTGQNSGSKISGYKCIVPDGTKFRIQNLQLQISCPWRDKIPDPKSPVTNVLSLTGQNSGSKISSNKCLVPDGTKFRIQNLQLQISCPWRDKIPDPKSPATNVLSLTGQNFGSKISGYKCFVPDGTKFRIQNLQLQMSCPWRDKIPDAKSPATNVLSLTEQNTRCQISSYKCLVPDGTIY
jgi:hypothetical protein